MPEKQYQLRYLVMPDFVYKDNSFSWIQARILSFLYSYKGDRFYFSNEHLASMFNVYPDSISRSLKDLKKKGYIDIELHIKAGGGKIRFIRVVRSDNSNLSDTTTPNLPNGQLYTKDNKLKDNKLKEYHSPIFNKKTKPNGQNHSPTTPLSVKKDRGIPGDTLEINPVRAKFIVPEKSENFGSIKDIGEAQFTEIAEKYHVPMSLVLNSYDSLINYCEANGRRYKNYLAALRNFVKKDAETKGYKPMKKEPEERDYTVSADDRAKARKVIEKMRERLVGKFNVESA